MGALSLWLPILLSAVFVFVVSSVIHMVLTYHRSDFKGLPDEGGVMDALRPFGIPQGEYFFPYAQTAKEMGTPEYKEKLDLGPVGFMTVCSSDFGTGKSLVQWFVYCLAAGLLTAYLGVLALDPGAAFLAVFRFTSTAAFGAYAFALFQNSIWYKRGWSTTLKSVFDGFVYSAVTGATFAWLWP